MKPITEITASDLPFLIVHGEWIWKVLLLILIATSLTSSWLLVRRRRRGKRARRVSSHTVLATIHGLTSIEGVVRGSAITVSQGETSRSDHSGGTHIVTDAGVRIELVGPIHVNSGYADAHHPWLSRDVPPKLRGDFELMTSTVVRTIYDGDRVLVAGHIGAEGLEARPDTPLLVTAIPAATKRWPSLVWTGVVGLVFGVFWVYMLQWVGDRALEKAGYPASIRNPATQIAAAMPGSREKMLEAATIQPILGRHPEYEVRDQIALAAMRGECPDVILMLAKRPVEALAAARRCAPHRVDGPMMLLGMYDELATLPKKQLTQRAQMVVALATGKYGEAAAHIDRMLDRQSEQVRQDLECFAALLRTFGGETNAFANLGSHDTGECRLFKVLSNPFAEWKEGLEAINVPQELFGEAHELWVVAGGDESYASDLRIVSLPTVLSAHSRSPSAALGRGRRAAVMGDFDMAALEYKKAHVDGLEDYDLYVAETELAYRTGGRSQAPTGARAKLAYEFERVLKTYLDDCGLAAIATALARGGDGRMFAHLTERCRGDSMMGIAEIAGGLTAGRAELAHALRWSMDDELRFGIRFPFTLLHHASWSRDVARILGDDAEADALHDMVVRHMRVLEDPRRAIPLYFWSEWTWSWPMW